MNSKNLDSVLQRVINYSFYSLFFFVPFIWYSGNSELFEFNKMVATYAITTFVVGSWLARCVLHGKFIFQKSALDIPLLLFLLSLLLSTFFSIDRHTSIWGYYSRSNGGLLSIFSYLLLYWAYVSNIEKENVKLHVKALLSSSLIISIYAILEHFGFSFSCVLLKGEFNTNCWVQDVQNRVFATLGQPNWLAAWVVAIVPLAWTQLLNSKIKNQNAKIQIKIIKVLTFSSPLLLFSAILFTKSRSGILALFGAWGLFCVLSFLRAPRSFIKPFLILNSLFLILILAFGSPWTPHISDVLADFNLRLPSSTINHKTGSLSSTSYQSSIIPSTGTVLESGGTNSFEIRQIVWKGAINVWKAYPLFGSGVETFAFSYYQYRPVEHNKTSEWDFLYNKAHNEYLNYLSTTGIFGLGSYLSIIITFLLWSIYQFKIQKSKVKISNQKSKFFIFDCHFDICTLHFAFLSGYVSILITNYAGFSVVPTATLFYLFPAMVFVNTQNQKAEKQKTYSIDRTNTTTLFLILCFLLYVLSRILAIWRADLAYAQADKLIRRGLPHYAAEPLGNAINLRPDEPLYYDKYATALSQISATLFETDEATRSADIATDADKLEQKALSISPRNIPIIKSAHTNYLLLGGVDEKYLKKSHDLIEYLSQLSPTDPRVFYLLGASYRRLGEKERAIESVKKSLELKPDYDEAKTALEEWYN